VPGKCDKCGAELYQRPDDKEETVRERLKIFSTQTIPIIDYYKKQNKLVEINGNLDIPEVAKEIVSILK
jgi:adenylate kinase